MTEVSAPGLSNRNISTCRVAMNLQTDHFVHRYGRNGFNNAGAHSRWGPLWCIGNNSLSDHVVDAIDQIFETIVFSSRGYGMSFLITTRMWPGLVPITKMRLQKRSCFRNIMRHQHKRFRSGFLG